jgi:hypothetical protein
VGQFETLALEVRNTLVPPIDDQYLGPALRRAAQLRENQRRASYDPAITAGVESRLWELGDIVKVVEAWEAALG